MVTFIHFSDTHLGYSNIENQDENGNNIREYDFYNSFKSIVDDIIKLKPDFVIHSGDLFHRSTPSNRSIVFANSQINRLSVEGIPFFIIAGNHDLPKSIFTEPINKIFDEIDNTYSFYDEKYVIIEKENFIIHALPHINNEQKYNEEVKKINITNKNKPNILIMHTSIEKTYLMEELGERIFPKECEVQLKEFAYVALGHWHTFNHIKNLGNVFYAGSIERESEKETTKEKGYVLVTIDNKTEVKFIAIKTRVWEKCSVKECFKKSSDEILKEVSDWKINSNVKDAIISLTLEDLLPTQVYDIPKSKLDEMFCESFYFSYNKINKDTKEVITSDSSTFDLNEILAEKLKESFNGEDEFQKAWEITNRHLTQIEEEEANENQ